MRIGLYGGSFDPVHNGHLLVAQAAVEEFGLDRLTFIPAARSPFKPDSLPAPAPERLRLLRLALAGRNRFQIDDREIRRGGVSYTVDTVRELSRRWPSARLFYLIGADHVATLPKWKESTALAELVDFLVIPRPGSAPVPLPSGFRGRELRGFPLGVSSSAIRERVKSGLAIDLLVPSMVAEAIANNRLYL